MWYTSASHILFTVALLATCIFPRLVDCTHSETVFDIQDTYIGYSFFEGFNFSTFDDPTHGRVNYVSKEEAIQKGLAYVSGDKFVMRADSTNKVLPGARGRDSVRIRSSASYSDSIIVLDLSHMPEGCSTWPAFWTKSAKGPWPHGGEIDIIEGVNTNTANLASLHTTPDCTMPGEYDNLRFMSGEITSTNCDTKVNFNQGCGVRFRKQISYGSDFNRFGGGWYVMQRTAQRGVSIWFWSRNDATVPSEVKYGRPTLDPSVFTWDIPDAYFPFSPSCNANHFDAHQIIFDDTFCGDFAGALYPDSGCPGTCTDLVDNYPEAFQKAYWEINALRVYTPRS